MMSKITQVRKSLLQKDYIKSKVNFKQLKYNEYLTVRHYLPVFFLYYPAFLETKNRTFTKEGGGRKCNTSRHTHKVLVLDKHTIKISFPSH